MLKWYNSLQFNISLADDRSHNILQNLFWADTSLNNYTFIMTTYKNYISFGLSKVHS